MSVGSFGRPVYFSFAIATFSISGLAIRIGPNCIKKTIPPWLTTDAFHDNRLAKPIAAAHADVIDGRRAGNRRRRGRRPRWDFRRLRTLVRGSVSRSTGRFDRAARQQRQQSESPARSEPARENPADPRREGGLSRLDGCDLFGRVRSDRGVCRRLGARLAANEASHDHFRRNTGARRS